MSRPPHIHRKRSESELHRAGRRWPRVAATVLAGALLVAGSLAGPTWAAEPDEIGGVPTSTTPASGEGADGEDQAGDGAPADEADEADAGEGADGGDEDSDGSGDPTSTTAPTTSVTTTSTTEAHRTSTTRAPETTSTTMANPLLVAGPPSERRQLDPDPEPEIDIDGVDASMVGEPETPSPGADDAERVIRLVVIGLVVVAVLLAALAVYYWWITRPEPVLDPTEDERGDDDDGHGDGEDGGDDGDGGGGDEGDDSDGTVDPWLTDSTSTR